MPTKDSGTGGGGRRPTGSTGRNRNAYCSFCRKSHTDVGPLVEGPGEVYICGECVSLCQDIIDRERRLRDVAPAVTGQSVRGTLDKLVSGQEYVKSILTEAALRRSEGKRPVLLIGARCGRFSLRRREGTLRCSAPRPNESWPA